MVMCVISIIIPVYNVAPYLERCLDSIVNQVYKKTEIIIIDDGSTDESPKICDKYALKDNRIKVIHKKNGGLSDARNVGLSIATGDMVAFVDSDDWVSLNYLQEMYRQMIANKADIIECGFVRTAKKVDEDYESLNNRIKTYNVVDAMQALITDNELHQVVWNKLYRKEVIGDTFFELGKYNEDEFWTYQIFARSTKIVKIDACLYYYFQNSTSIMGQKYNLKRLDAIEGKVYRQNLINNIFPELSNIAATNLMDSIIYAGQMSLKYLDKKSMEIAYDKLTDYIRQNIKANNYSFMGSIVHRIWNTCALYNLKFVCRVRNLFGINL